MHDDDRQSDTPEADFVGLCGAAYEKFCRMKIKRQSTEMTDKIMDLPDFIFQYMSGAGKKITALSQSYIHTNTNIHKKLHYENVV